MPCRAGSRLDSTRPSSYSSPRKFTQPPSLFFRSVTENAVSVSDFVCARVCTVLRALYWVCLWMMELKG
eukprot:COSAG06_NODE_8753_length_2079_cov_1.176263_3_plen_69_part_00